MKLNARYSIFVAMSVLVLGVALAGPAYAERPDGDNDGLFDDDESEVYFTDPADPDTDNDGPDDGQEVYDGTDPLVANGAGPHTTGQATTTVKRPAGEREAVGSAQADQAADLAADRPGTGLERRI